MLTDFGKKIIILIIRLPKKEYAIIIILVPIKIFKVKLRCMKHNMLKTV